jgi:formate-dependent nitrite reductase membrane component NrfD
MSRVPLPDMPSRVPDAESERRLAEIRREAAEEGVVPSFTTRPGAASATHVQRLPHHFVPAGAPFPRATAETGYYGIPLLKPPQWKPEVPLYFFIGGAAGASAVIACAANLMSRNNNDGLVTHARWIAAGGGVLSGALLTKDLGMPSRFINMLRVFKPQSPMSLGAWTLTAFSTFSAAAAFANRMRQELDSTSIHVVENISGVMAAATGLIMASYTGVLIGGTTVPVWNCNIGTLPAHFAASGLNSAVSILELMGNDDSRALNILGIAASVYESLEGAKLEAERTRVNEPLRKGFSGLMVRLGGVLSGPVPLCLRIASAIAGNKEFRHAAAYSSIAGSLLTRFGWVQAGKASARDHRLPLELSGEESKFEKSAVSNQDLVA